MGFLALLLITLGKLMPRQDQRIDFAPPEPFQGEAIPEMENLLAELDGKPSLRNARHSQFVERLRENEGTRLNQEGFDTVFLDTKGVLTGPGGVNVPELERREGRSLNLQPGDLADPTVFGPAFDRSVAVAEEDAQVFMPEFESFNEPVQEALTEMAFILGRSRLSKFVNFKAALERGDFEQAAREVENSKLTKDIKRRRTKSITSLIRQGAKK